MRTALATDAGSSAVAGFAAARRAMVDSQLRTSGVNDRPVLQRMLAVPREDFVPARARGIAYMDRALPLDNGPDGQPRYLAAPVFHGMMLQEADPSPNDRALVIEGGSGYLAELLRPMVGSLETVSPDRAVRGEAPSASYSLILIDGAIGHVPGPLAALLDREGRALTGLIEDSVTRLAIGRRAGDTLALLPLAEMGIPVLPEFVEPKSWTF